MNNDDKKIALLDINDIIIGYGDKLAVHQDGLLHRAFSILVFNDKNEVLLQKRASTKYHSPSLWTNTCCSHLVENQDFETYMHKRLQDEMGFDCDLSFQFSFHYKIKFENGLFENEIDHIYFGKWQGTPNINPDEADDFKWLDWDKLLVDVKTNPDNYTYWFKELLGRVKV